MKNILKLSFVVLVSFLLFSCTKNDDMATLTSSTSPTLVSSKTAVVLSSAAGSSEAINFKWTDPTNNLGLVINSQLQFALKGSNFANAKTVDLPKGTNSISYLGQDFNAIMIGLGLPLDGTTTDVQVRVKSSLFSLDGSAVNAPQITYSPVLDLSVKPYALISYLYAVGAFQGWDINSAQALVSGTSNGIYVGYLNFKDVNTEFLVVPVKGSYDNKFGSNDNVNLISGGGDNLKAANAGSQKITVDTNKLTFSLTPYSWGMLGTAVKGGNGYGDPDTNLIFNANTQLWELTLALVPGDFKFRLNHKWELNYGDDGNNGSLEAGGANIPITDAGNYKITFDETNLVWTKTKM